jgi:hypothetical protein
MVDGAFDYLLVKEYWITFTRLEEPVEIFSSLVTTNHDQIVVSM